MDDALREPLIGLNIKKERFYYFIFQNINIWLTAGASIERKWTILSFFRPFLE